MGAASNSFDGIWSCEGQVKICNSHLPVQVMHYVVLWSEWNTPRKCEKRLHSIFTTSPKDTSWLVAVGGVLQGFCMLHNAALTKLQQWPGYWAFLLLCVRTHSFRHTFSQPHFSFFLSLHSSYLPPLPLSLSLISGLNIAILSRFCLGQGYDL